MTIKHSKEDVWAHVLRLRVAEREGAQSLPAERIVIAYFVMQTLSAEVEPMLAKRAFIQSLLGGVRNAELHNTYALVQHNLVPRRG